MPMSEVEKLYMYLPLPTTIIVNELCENPTKLRLLHWIFCHCRLLSKVVYAQAQSFMFFYVIVLVGKTPSPR